MVTSSVDAAVAADRFCFDVTRDFLDLGGCDSKSSSSPFSTMAPSSTDERVKRADARVARPDGDAVEKVEEEDDNEVEEEE
jgi:hypothetical protein